MSFPRFFDGERQIKERTGRKTTIAGGGTSRRPAKKFRLNHSYEQPSGPNDPFLKRNCFRRSCGLPNRRRQLVRLWLAAEVSAGLACHSLVATIAVSVPDSAGAMATTYRRYGPEQVLLLLAAATEPARLAAGGSSGVLSQRSDADDHGGV